ncbi:MAG: glutaminase [Rhodospirillaceae bacterium]
MDWQTHIERIAAEIRPQLKRGRVATYIEALARVPRDRFGMAVRTVGGEEYFTGDADMPFSIQSISKVFTLTMAMNHVGDRLWKRVGREPSGNPFNSLVQLEREEGIPRNPFINAGAHVVTDEIAAHCDRPMADILAFVRRISGNPAIRYDEEVAASERETGYRNFALANFLKSFGNLEGEVDSVLDLYFHQCAIAMSCRDLCRAAGFLANDGIDPASSDRIVPKTRARRINSLMLTCGLYDAVGNFAFRVGLPAKSGVGGGIVAVWPGRLTVCVWSPGLDSTGNSLAGTRALELFAQRTGATIF